MATINKNTKLYAGDKFAITTTDGRKLRLVIDQDQFPDDPRSWDNLGTMLCCHRDYRLGDLNSNKETEEQLAEICRKYGKSDEEIDEMTFAEEIQFILDQDDICGLPLWIYDHSGISISTGRVCQFDSSFVGIIFVDREMFFQQTCLKDDYNWKKDAEKMLQSEIEIYNCFLEGDVCVANLFEPVVEIHQNLNGEELNRAVIPEGELIDSIGGLYNPTIESVIDYFPFEIDTIENVDD